MRKSTVAIAVLLIGLGMLAAGSYAQARRSRRGRSRGPGLAEALAKLDLTESKQRQIHRILSAEQDLRQEAAKETAKLQDDLLRAREAGDTAESQAIRARIAERGRGGPAARRRMVEEIKKILTPQQSAELDELLAGASREAKISAALRELTAMDLNIRQEAVDKAMAEAIEKIKQALTAEQRERMAGAMERPATGRGGFGDMSGMFGAGGAQWANMSDEQRAAAREIAQEYMAKIRNAEGEERRELFREMRQKMQQVATGTEGERADQPEQQAPEDEQEGEQE